MSGKITVLLILFTMNVMPAEKISYTSDMEAEIVHDTLVITHSTTIIPDCNTMVRNLFNIFDNLPKDGYLSYREIKIFQYITNPELPLTYQIWKWICNILDSNHMTGVDIIAFNSSYYNQARELMGTDLVRDWTRVYEASQSRYWM